MFLVDPVRGSDGTYPWSPAGWSIVPVQELKSAVKLLGSAQWLTALTTIV